MAGLARPVRVGDVADPDHDRLVGRNVRLRFDALLTSRGRSREDRDGTLAVPIDASLDERATLGHEAIHAPRARGLLQDAAWRVLWR